MFVTLPYEIVGELRIAPVAHRHHVRHRPLVITQGARHYSHCRWHRPGQPEIRTAHAADVAGRDGATAVFRSA